MSEPSEFRPVLKKHGQIVIEDVPGLTFCKPRLIPLKSYTLEKLEKIQQEAQKVQEDIKKQ